jgi:hypothetical protein
MMSKCKGVFSNSELYQDIISAFQELNYSGIAYQINPSRMRLRCFPNAFHLDMSKNTLLQ